ncbi:MAG: DUF354 domain-containing protein [Rhodobacteraceae bacterium]|nr:DUF354 domain-containing protein [Paracoccaceae bacterium]
MRIIFDIVHPADVLFFKRPVEIFRARGDEVLLVSREKDVAISLIEEFGFPHECASRQNSGLLGLGLEMLRRDITLLRIARRFRPDVMIGFGGVAIAHVGRLLSIPSVSFYDSENATLQTRVTWPFIGHLYVPRSYDGPVPEGRTTRVPGTKELSYLHPAGFTPDREVAARHGLDPGQENFLVRVVAWRANHDVGKAGWSPDLLRKVVGHLAAQGKVHLSSELPLPDELDRLRYKGPARDIHHLVGCCRLLVGESATMASEAAVMGVPGIYAGRDFPGYVRELEAAGLLTNVEEVTEARVLGAIENALATPLGEIAARRDAHVASCPDWAHVVVDALDAAARLPGQVGDKG